MLGLCGGLEAAHSSPMAGLASEIYICTDNLNNAKEAGSVPNGSSQAAFILLIILLTLIISTIVCFWSLIQLKELVIVLYNNCDIF